MSEQQPPGAPEGPPTPAESSVTFDYRTPGTHPELEAGTMPGWTTGELADPPKIKSGILAILGPGLMMAGAAIGGGEWLMGPAVTARYGGVVMWLALVSILTQVAYNVEVSRYALYCGESIFVGFMRLLPGPRFWTGVYLFVDFFGLWPYLAANAAVPLAAAILGHLPAAQPLTYMPPDQIARETGVQVDVVKDIQATPQKYGEGAGKTPLPPAITEWSKGKQPQVAGEAKLRNWLAYAIFAGCFIPLIFGGKIYTVLERIMVVKVVLVLGYLLFLGIFYVSGGTWAQIFGGFVGLGPDASGSWAFRFLPTGPGSPPLDWALLGAFAAIAGQGGMNNSQFSSYCRDRGWGMGGKVGAIGSIVGGRDVKLAHTGKVFEVNPETMVKWKGWLRVVFRDQWAIWFVGCILGVAIPALISMEYLRADFVAGKTFSGDEVAAKTAQALQAHTGRQVFWFMTLLCGFLVLAPNQITAADGLIRRWTELLWTGNRKLHKLDTSKVRYVYFSLLTAYLIWGLLILVWTGDKPLIIVKASGVIMNFALGFTALHTLAVNTLLLPKPLRPGWLGRIGISSCAVFFLVISALGVPQVIRDLTPAIRRLGELLRALVG
jgi:Mn2+/Fe2+ NRAMP family transporter